MVDWKSPEELTKDGGTSFFLPRSICPRAMRLTCCLVPTFPPQLPLIGSCIRSSGSICMSFPRSRDCPLRASLLCIRGERPPLTTLAFVDGSSLHPFPSTGSTSLGRGSLSGLWCVRKEARTSTVAPTLMCYCLLAGLLLFRPLLPSFCVDWHVRSHRRRTTYCMHAQGTDYTRRSLHSIVAQNVTTYVSSFLVWLRC